MEIELKNFTDYLTNNYINYISSIHNFVPATYKYSLVGEFGGVSSKYARILIVVNRKNTLESYYKKLPEEINLDLIKKQIRYSFMLAKESGLFTPDQFNGLIDNILDSYYTIPMHRVESLFRKCVFSTHKDVRIGDEFVPLSYSEYSQITNPLRNSEDLIKVAYVNYITKWPDQDIEYIHSFIALEDFDSVEAGDVLAVKDFDKADKTKVVGSIKRPTTYLDLDWRTIK